MPTYEKTFPGWEVIYLANQGWDQVKPFLELKEKNAGKWWVPGEELNADFTDFVESWMNHWVGYVEETVFDVNMLVIDPKNVVCNNYNQQVFDAFSRRGITPHVINFRHRYFWDGGLHCITSDLHREGVLNDYFPERA
jgi:arginine deiminase